ncbi:MAG: TonB-dependent receptor [Bryobacteraceae bacterium]
MRSLAVSLLLACASALAQVSTGTINLEVKDTSGAVMPGVTVVLTQTATGLTREGTTNDRGELRASFMPIGEYTITASLQGFKRQTVRGLVLRVDQDANIAVTLEPGEVREVVEVTGATPLLEASSSAIGQVIENKKILDLPLNGRNPFALGLLAGNTTPMFGMGSNLPFIGGGGRFSSNEVMLDGIDNNTTQNAGAVGRSGIAYTPSVDAVQEFKVKTNNFSAEFGHSAGTVVNATIKSGQNEFHGSLFEFMRNDKLDANNFFTNAAGQPKGKFRQNQFGGAAGGRIFRDRTFWFADIEATRIRQQASSSILDVPPADVRAGDFSARPTITVFDPSSRRVGPAGTVIGQPFANNRIPASQINPTAKAITDLVPLPNFGTPGSLSRNFFRQRPNQFRGDRGDLRLDHKLSNNNNIYARYSLWNQRQPIPGVFEGFIGGGARRIDFSRHAVIGDTHIFSPSVVNEFRFGFVRHNGSDVGDAPSGVGFAQANKLALFPFPDLGFPSISFNFSGNVSGSQQFSSWGGGASNYNIENTFQWSDNLNITRGNHTLKFGGDLRRNRYNVLKGSPFYGNIVFGSIFSSSSDRQGSGAPLADFLMGFPSFYEGTQMLDWGRHRWIYFGTYFQDDWKVSRKLTFNLGVRYELYTQAVDARDRGSLFNVKTGKFQLPGVNGFSRSIVDGDHNNIGPRFGFAYQWSPKLVIRGGYGIFYGLRDQNQETSQFSGNNPNVPTLTFPVVDAARTVAPPFTINTPVVAAPSDTTLESFTADRPFVRTIRTQIFNGAKFPLLHQANVSFQWEPKANWLLETTLSTSRGRDLATAFLHSNQVPFEYALDGRNIQRFRPFPNVNGTVPTVDSTGTSSYHAVNFKVEKRFAYGLSFLVNYTIQKNMETNGTGPSSFTQNGGTSFVFDNYNLSRERAVAPIDVPQILVASYGYEIPVFKRNKILGGWQVNGITTLRGGFPSDLRTNVLAPIFNTFNLPDVVPGATSQVQSGRSVDNFFDPSAFKVPGTVRSTAGANITMLGNAARRNVRGPGSVNADFSAFKNTRITERYAVQFRAEFFNLTNTPTFFLPSASSNNMTCIGPAGGACNAGNPAFGKLSNGTATGRQIQFGLKFLF